MTMEKTLLVISLPGTGKTTAAKVLNFAEKEFDRPAIDFDYRGTRFKYDTSSDVRVAQSKLFNIFADHHVRVILTHWNAIRIDSLNINKFKLLFIIPTERKINQVIEDIRYRDGVGSEFADRCEEHYYEWVEQIRQVWRRAKKRFKENCFYTMIDEGYYVIDALYQCCQPHYSNMANPQSNMIGDALCNIQEVIERPKIKSFADGSALEFIKLHLINNISIFMSFCADDGILVKDIPYFKRWDAQALNVFKYEIKYQVIGEMDPTISWAEILAHMRRESQLENEEMYNSDDNVDEYLSTFGN